MAKKNAAPTKSEILASISKETELSKKQVGAVFDSLSASFNGEKMMFKAKPASKKVRIAALKTLKEFVN
jgi:DNA-binding protein HU-beta